MNMSYLNDVDEDLFTQHVLETYEKWLEEFLEIIRDRINHCGDDAVAGHLYMEIKVKCELENVRGMY